MFENRVINGYIYETRFIASWLKVGGQLRYGEDIDDFYEWLLSIGVSEDDANHIVELATCGKLELEINAKKFLSEH